MIHDSGKRQEFGTGSVRDTNEGKGRCDLLPPRALLRLARHYEAGAGKYGDRNWELGQPQSRFFDSAMRHLLKYQSGLRDEDHLVAALWNVIALVDQEERAREGLLNGTLIDFPPSIHRQPQEKSAPRLLDDRGKDIWEHLKKEPVIRDRSVVGLPEQRTRFYCNDDPSGKGTIDVSA